MDLKRKKILVTGADGFIGSHLTEELVRQGCDVRAFVCYNSQGSWGWLDQASAETKKSLDIFPGDIRDAYGVRKAVEGCSIIFHLAALISIPFSYHSPEAYADTNIKGTLNLLQAARDAGIEKMIHTSTSEVYGSAQYVPINEEHPLHPQSPYAATKVGADQMALSFYYSFGLPVTVARPFNTYGPRQSARAIIPTIITQIASGAGKIKLGSLSPTRDFTYVQDTVQGFFAIAKEEKTVGQVLNIGSGFEVSVGETARLIAEQMKADIEIEQEEQRLRPDQSEVQRLWADYSKLKKLTGWEPRYAGKEGFQKGLAETIQWFVPAENLAKYKADVYSV